MDLSIYAKSNFVWGLTLLLLGLLAMPMFRFIAYGWERKRRDVVCGLTSDSIKLYFEQFYPNEIRDNDDVNADFEHNFQQRFGRYHYTFPAIFLGAVAGFSLFLLTGTTASWLGILSSDAGALPGIAVAAISGAYMWVLGDLITKTRRVDLAPATLSWGAFRFVVAVPFGYAFSHMFDQALAIPIAFLIGVFPTSTLRRIAGRMAARKMNIGEMGEEGISELERLQCVNTSNAEAFANEGVTTILQLAYADPIDLTIRTSFSFSYVIDCVSQALAWIYFEDELKKLRVYSLRGAQEIRALVLELDGSYRASAKSRAKTSLQHIAETLDRDPVVLERTFREIAEDPYTKFLCEVWQ